MDSALHAQLLVLQTKQGATLTWLLDTAVRQYLDDTRLYLDVPDDTRAKLRERCVAQGRTMNEIVNEILKEVQ